MNWINDKIINKSEVARQLGISPGLFRMKLNNINRNRFTRIEIIKLRYIKMSLRNLCK